MILLVQPKQRTLETKRSENEGSRWWRTDKTGETYWTAPNDARMELVGGAVEHMIRDLSKLLGIPLKKETAPERKARKSK
jgi:hypothetical protein